jgi:hypothetical protein
MSYRHDLAARLALLKVLASELAAARRAAEEELHDSWHPGDRNTAALPDGALLGAVTFAKGRAVAKLTDEAAFRDWVSRTHPDQIETIIRVAPAFTERIMSAARQLGEPVDADTGEQVPGITVEHSDPYPTVRLTPTASDTVAKAWQDGTLGELLAGLLAITGGT